MTAIKPPPLKLYATVMSTCMSVHLFVCLSLETPRLPPRMSHMFLPPCKTPLREIYACGGGLLAAYIKAPHLFGLQCGCYSKSQITTVSMHKQGWVINNDQSRRNFLLYTTENVLPNDNVSMSVGHLDHVLIVYSSMEHVTWRSPGPMCGWVGRILHPDSCTSVSSWSKVPLLSIRHRPCIHPLLSSHNRPCRGREPCHQLGQGKSGRQRSTVTDQMDKRGNLDQEDTDVHESGCRILLTQLHDFQVTCSVEL